MSPQEGVSQVRGGRVAILVLSLVELMHGLLREGRTGSWNAWCIRNAGYLRAYSTDLRLHARWLYTEPSRAVTRR